MKKVFNLIFVCVLTVFSFYYTDKLVTLSKSKDNIMISIMNNKDNYETSFVNATISDDCITPGLNGKVVDINKSYNKMKEFGNYNDNLFIFDISKPDVSIENTYDKFIVGGNKNKKQVSLVFTLTNDTYLNSILYILNNNNTVGNFFVDGKYFNDKFDYLKEISDKHLLGVFGYDGVYDKTTIKNSISLIEKFVNYDHNYCYVKSFDYEALDICSKLKMYTIMGNNVSSISPYSYVKENLKNGIIFNFSSNSFTVNELGIIIKYINQKGYEIVSIDGLLNEEI